VEGSRPGALGVVCGGAEGDGVRFGELGEFVDE